jgi:hypothetical protein
MEYARPPLRIVDLVETRSQARMSRDRVLGENVVWRGTPKVVEAPATLRVAALVLFALSAVSLCFAVVISFSLHVTPTESLVFAGWSTLVGVLAIQAPKIWLEKVEYIVTERHVVMQRGPFRRSIERRAISFARIRWSAGHPGVGDMDLVRAVPTGALRRRLLLQLRGVAAPDRVWAIVRGVESSIEPHRGDRPLAQRLDDGERVVWSARPRRTRHAHVPRGRRELGVLGLSGVLFATFVTMLLRAIPNLRVLVAAGLRDWPFAALLVGEGISATLVLGAAVYLAIDGLITPLRQLDRTRYLITDRRVLIQRGREELHLDRERIVDVIPTPGASGLTDVFLVLDGPRARALAIGGAFGESDLGPQLHPILESVEDAESVSRILLARPPTPPESRQAA